MSASPREPRVVTLEQALIELAQAQARTQANLDRQTVNLDRQTVNLDRLSEEMREFKAEMRAADERSRRQWGELANSMGTLAEDIVAPGIPGVFQHLFGETPLVNVRLRRRHPADPGRTREFDVVAEGMSVVLVNETRSRLKPEHLPEVLDVLLTQAREYLPETRGRRLVGSVASFYVDPSLVRAGERAGLLVLGLSRGILEVLNTEGFRPREF